MGGGSSKKYSSAASYDLEPVHNQPTMKTIAQKAKLSKRKFTQDELLAMYAIEDKLYQEKMKAKKEREYRQERSNSAHGLILVLLRRDNQTCCQVS